ncbi:MAG: AbrB/MazE/SpoVT family DNA-binding domain-containing protein [Rubrobacter sp.]|jgi:AbrB family looped-hinge helix DNA binding protein|nr:AbrB/MazE/SpoVT family DNA-binding domain-containing protein [Rubrobacter sp.]
MAHAEDETRLESYSATVGARGRVVLPSALRERLGLRDGDRLVMTVQPDGSVRMTSLREAVRSLRGMYAHLAPGRSLVDELIEERREEARREDVG